MNNLAIVYWSGTGNTEMMANCIADGVREAGGEAVLIAPGEFSAGRLDEFGAVAFGCPSMGVEQLEDGEFDPMFSEVEPSLSGRKIALFGSYGWGDGQWMRDWCERAKEDGAQLFSDEGLVCNETPDDDVQAACRKLGADLANW